ncbi:MAG: SET domain-containing protein [Methanobacteriota archaeon]
MNPRPRHRAPANGTLEVRASPIHGRGLFAAAVINRRAFIAEYVGRRVSKTQGDRIARRQERLGMIFVFDVAPGIDIDGDVPQNIARFANHSCDPNAEIQIRRRRVFLEARRKIRGGEEITYDYECDLDDRPLPCLCGSPRCRRLVIARAEARKLRAQIQGGPAAKFRFRKFASVR